jgi:hypothetical protein
MSLPTKLEIEIAMTGKPIDILARLPIDSMATKLACYYLDKAREQMREAVDAEEARRQG